MPIVNMTRREDVTPQIPTLGKLRKGGPKPDPRRPGPDLEYWRFTSDVPAVEAAFYAAYPNNPTEIDAYLPFAKMEQNWATWLEEYDAGGLVHRCDGETMYRWRTADGSYKDGERPCPYSNGTTPRTKERPGCKPVGRLHLIIPALLKAGHVGFVTMETHSINDLVSITACLRDIEERAGRLNGILMSIMRVPQIISTPAWKEGSGTRNRTKKWLVRVVPAAEWVQAQLARQHDEAMTISAPPLQLAAPALDEDDDADEVGDFAVKEGGARAIIARLRDAGSADARPLDDALRKKLWGHLSVLTGRDEARIRELLAAVFGVTQTSALTAGQANALIGWIASRPVRDDDGKIVDWVSTGPAKTAGEYELLFPPTPKLFDAEANVEAVNEVSE